jgi:alkylhydroperoxidase family enzyme
MAMAMRISPARPPFAAEVADRLQRLTPEGATPLVLFTTLARDRRLFERFMAGGLLDRGHLRLRQREIVIDRITGLCRCEYEWGVHVALFAARAGLDDAQVASTAKGGGADPVWSDEERALLAVCDQLHRQCDIDEHAWRDLKQYFSEEAILEILLLAGFYRSVSCIANALRLPREAYAARFPQ